MSIWVVKQSDVNVNKQKCYVIHAVIIQQHVIINDFGQNMHVYFIFEITSIIYLAEVVTSTRHIYISMLCSSKKHIF